MFLLFCLLFPTFHTEPAPNFWGFYAHRLINRHAVYSLPPEMMVFYRKNIDWIADHATDADVRRYASHLEAPRHFIDLDAFDSLPPRSRFDAMFSMTQIWGIPSNGGDSVLLPICPRDCFARLVLPRFFDKNKWLPLDSVADFFPNFQKNDWQAVFFTENFTAHGILPWHLQKMQRDLTHAFRQKNARQILRFSTDMGHYLADAHVPLHTCSNYNGQKTEQHGIHAFWESRLPELFAEAEYDFWVGKAQYLPATTDFFWEIILESNRLADSVLLTEKLLRRNTPPDQQICAEPRGRSVVLIQCRDFARAWQNSLAGMVERRMQAAILALASVWYTAWVDAGQPNLSNLDTPRPTTAEIAEEKMWQQKMQEGKILGRPESH